MWTHEMAGKSAILFFINAVIASELTPPPPNGGQIASLIASENQPIDIPHGDVNTLNTQIPENNYENVIELQKDDPTPCQSTTFLIPILNQLLNLLMQDPSNANKVSRISALLQEYLKNLPENNENKLANTDDPRKDSLRTYHGGASGHVKTKIVFKYDLPSINQPQCKDVFMKLIKSAYDAYVQLAKDPLCQNSDILEAILKNPYAVPYNLNNNLSPNSQSKKEEYSIYDFLKPQTDKSSYGYQPEDVHELGKFYGDYKTTNLYGMPSNLGTLESNPSIIDPDKLKPKVYDLNAYGYGNNPTAPTPPDVSFYNPETYSKDNLPYNGDLNIYNIYGNSKQEPIAPKDSNTLFPGSNLHLDSFKLPEDSWKNSLNVPTDGLNGKNQNPVDSILSMLATVKNPNEKDKDKTMKLSYENYPNINQNDVPGGQNMYYSYNPNQDNNLPYQYVTPVNPTIATPPQNGEDISNYLTQHYPVSNQGIPTQQANTLQPYMQNMYNNYLNKLSVVPNTQPIGVPNAFKLEPSNAGVIELTFVVKHATPLIYQPLYFVKFRMPYSAFLYNIRNLLQTKPHLQINPLKLYQELISLSNVSDVSPGLKGYKKEDILKLAYKSGELVTAKLVKDDNALNERLKLVQNLNSGIGAADILKLNKYNGFLKRSSVQGNSSDSLVGRYGKVIAPYYDLGSSGIGYNTEPITRLENRQDLNLHLRPISFGSFGNTVVRPKQQLSGLSSQKSTLGTFSLGVNV